MVKVAITGFLIAVLLVAACRKREAGADGRVEVHHTPFGVETLNPLTIDTIKADAWFSTTLRVDDPFVRSFKQRLAGIKPRAATFATDAVRLYVSGAGIDALVDQEGNVHSNLGDGQLSSRDVVLVEEELKRLFERAAPR